MSSVVTCLMCGDDIDYNSKTGVCNSAICKDSLDLQAMRDFENFLDSENKKKLKKVKQIRDKKKGIFLDACDD